MKCVSVFILYPRTKSHRHSLLFFGIVTERNVFLLCSGDLPDVQGYAVTISGRRENVYICCIVVNYPMVTVMLLPFQEEERVCVSVV
jgi:hypothetical protein